MKKKKDDSPGPILEAAYRLDRAGKEAEAIPLYRGAIKAGLSSQDLRDAMVCLGSSLRVVGKTAQARSVLTKAKSLHPADPVVSLFLALALHDRGDHDRALRELGLALIASSDLGGYSEPLRRYYRRLNRLPRRMASPSGGS